MALQEINSKGKIEKKDVFLLKRIAKKGLVKREERLHKRQRNTRKGAPHGE